MSMDDLKAIGRGIRHDEWCASRAQAQPPCDCGAAAALAALSRLEAQAKNQMQIVGPFRCPQCGTALQEVRYPEGSMLNRDQFDAVRAGDYYCTHCKGTESKTGFKYWWRSELEAQQQPKPKTRVRCECVDANGNPWPDCTCDHGWREAQAQQSPGEPGEVKGGDAPCPQVETVIPTLCASDAAPGSGTPGAQPTPPVECPRSKALEEFARSSNWATIPGAGRTGTDYACAWVGPKGPYSPDAFAREALSTPCQPCPTCAELREKTRQPLVGKESPEKVVESALVGATFGLDSRDGRNNQLRQRAYDGLVALPHLVAERDSLRDQVKRLRRGLRPFVEYIVARHELFGTESRASWPEMYVAGRQDIVRADWERIIALWAEHEEPEGRTEQL